MSTALLAIGLTVLLAGGLGLFAAVVVRPSPPRPADPAWLTGRSSGTPASRLLVDRYLRRVRSHRRYGALVGVGLAVVTGISREGTVTLGLGLGSPFGDLLFGGLAGLLVGSVLAETWRSAAARGLRTADLAVRDVDLEARAVRPLVLALTVATVALALPAPDGRSVALGAAGVLLAVTHVRALRSVALRGRPALPDDLRATDDAIRVFASRRLSLETLAGALLLLSWQAVGTGAAQPLASDVAAPLLLVTVFVLLFRSRPFPPRRFAVPA